MLIKRSILLCLGIGMQGGVTVKTDNSSIERVEEFKYLGTMITDQNSIQ